MTIPLFSTIKHRYGDIVQKTLESSGYNVIRISEKPPISQGQLANAPVAIVAYYGAIIPRETINLFPKGLLNIHPSLLPKYRGPSPAATAILNGDKTTGVTIFKLDEKMDHGPILTQQSLPVFDKDTRHTLLKRLFGVGAEVLIEILPDYMNNKLMPIPQDHSKATYTQMLAKEDGQIDWNKPDEYIKRQIHALKPWPGTWTKVDDKRVLINQAHLDKNGHLVIDEFQVAGKTPVKGSWGKERLLAYLS